MALMNRAADRDARSGALVGGKYRLVRLLGRGGMGAVYEAENTWTRRRVAAKLLRPEYARDKDALRRFMLEAQAAGQIAHPNIIDVLDLGIETSDGSLYMVQELLHGEDLRGRLRAAGTLTPREALEVLVPVMGALAAAHEGGVVHRDIKPENIYLSRDASGQMVPKLIDFGVSKVLEPGQTGALTGIGTTVGTPRYMAPEQVRGEPDVDERADVWSVGVVLYELLSGRNPFEAPTAFASVNRVLNERPPALDGMPVDLAAVVAHSLAPAKADRFADARALLDAVLALDEGKGLSERYASAIGRRAPTERRDAAPIVFELMSQLGAATDPTMPAPETPPARRRSRAALVVALVALIAPLTGVGWWMARKPAQASAVVAPAVPPPPSASPVAAPEIKPTEPSKPVDAPKRPARTTKTVLRPAKPSATEEEGTNRAPIVE